MRTWRSVVALLALCFGTRAYAQSPKPVPLEVPRNYSTAPAPQQPIPFSHKLHVTQDINCDYCHRNPAPGSAMTLPVASLCMGCHNSIDADDPSIRKLAEYAKTNQPVPWVRIYVLRPGLRWSHAPHLAAGKACGACHGDVGTLDQMRETTSTTTMYSCLSCHQKNKAKAECATCHVWP